MDTTEYTELRHIDRIVWKQITWLPESPDQYADGLPSDKEESMVISIPGATIVSIIVKAQQFSPELYIYEVAPCVAGADRAAPPPPISAAIPAELARDVFDALLELHRVGTRGATPVMRGIEKIVWKSRKALRMTKNYLSLLCRGTDEEGNREGIFFSFDRRSDTVAMHFAIAENLDPYGELCEHNAWSDSDLADAVFTIPVNNVPALAYAILHVHRRTREHDYQGPDAGLGTSSATI
jgi:hypothetical protein